MNQRLTVEAAAARLRAGKLVILPTETVYGLAANALDPDAVLQIFAAKERPRFNPIICHLPDAEAVFRYGDADDNARELAAHFWPGPLTLLLPHRGRIPAITTAGSPLAGFRVPAHPLALEVLRRVEFPLAAPSANRSGARSAVTADIALADLGDAVAGALDGGPCTVGLESTVVKLAGREAHVLRDGGVSREALEAAGFVVVDATRPAAEQAPLSPGQLLKHYAPALPLVVLEAGPASEAELDELRRRLVALAGPAPRLAWLEFGAQAPPLAAEFRLELSRAGDLREAARDLFLRLDELSELAHAGAAACLVRVVPEHGLGRAINDRLRRAAAFVFP